MSGGIHLRNTERGYGAVAKLLHWTIALLVVGMLCLGYVMNEVVEKSSSLQMELYQWHKIFGVTILGLVLVRLLWRWLNPVPRLPETVRGLERAGAKLVHWGFYALLLAMPATGLLMQGAFAFRDAPMFSGWIMEWFPFLRAVPVDEDLHHLFEEIHETIAWVILGLLVLHVGAALRHHFFKKDEVLKRMLPGSKP